MALSDEKLMILEQVAYSGDVLKALGISYGDLSEAYSKLMSLTDKQLEKLREMDKVGDGLGAISGKRWADIITVLREDHELNSLKCVDYNDDAKALCFESSTGEAYVAFKGTDGPDEWKDDADGLGVSDTPCQEAALRYINGLEYDHITVVGHSKGGNKAQYVALLSDKVDRCASMDGQGFSKEFLDKYWAEIEQNAYKLHCYSYKNDYVHVLLNYIPGATTIICDGTYTGFNSHCPDAFLNIRFNKETGEWEVFTENAEENPIITYLHEFTCFVANNMPQEDRERIGGYLGMLLAILLADGEYDIDGVRYDKSNIVDFLMTDKESAAKIIAYLVKYIKVYNLSPEQVKGFFEFLGIEDTKIFGNITLSEIIIKIVNNIDAGIDIAIIIGNIGVFPDDLKEVANLVKVEYNRIDQSINTSNTDHIPITGKVRDYSDEVLQEIISAINLIRASSSDNVDTWSTYSTEEWYGSVCAGIAQKGIKAYYSKLDDINVTCEQKITQIFIDINNLDKTYGERIKSSASDDKSLIIDLISIKRNLEKFSKSLFS